MPGHDIRKRGWNSPNVAVHPSIWSSNFVPNSWTTSSKVPSAPPNALCPLSDKAPQEISQRLPKVLHNSCHNPSAKSGNKCGEHSFISLLNLGIIQHIYLIR